MKKILIISLICFAIFNLYSAETVYKWKCFRCKTTHRMTHRYLCWAISEGRICAKCYDVLHKRTTIYESWTKSKVKRFYY